MRMRSRDNIRTSFVNGRVNRKRGLINRALADHDLAGAVHQQQVGNPHACEMTPKRIDPEMIGPFRIAGSDMSRQALVKTVAGKQAKRASQPLQAMPAFGWRLDDAQVAAVLTYIRNSWGNAAAPVAASTIASRRTSLAAAP